MNKPLPIKIDSITSFLESDFIKKINKEDIINSSSIIVQAIELLNIKVQPYLLNKNILLKKQDRFV